MANFETEVTLGINVDQGELRSARRAIETELGDVNVGVSPQSSSDRAMGGRGVSAGAAGSRESRRMFRWARQRTNDTEEIVELLADIEESLDDSGGLVGGGGGGGGFDLPTIIPRGGGGGGRGPGGGRFTGRSAAATALTLLPFAQEIGPFEDPQWAKDTRSTLFGSDEPIVDLDKNIDPDNLWGSLFGGEGGTPSDRSQRNAELLRRNQQRNLAAPEWMRQFLSGNVDAPRWVQEARNGTLFNTPSGQRAPDRPGGAERVRIDFETTVEAETGMSPDELESMVDGKLSELEREVARATGRGLGGTPIP